MASEQSIFDAVRKAIESNPLPATVEELDQATRRLFEREAAARAMTPQDLLEIARTLQDEELGRLNLALGSNA